MCDGFARRRIEQIAEDLHGGVEVAADVHISAARFTEAASEEGAEVGGALDEPAPVGANRDGRGREGGDEGGDGDGRRWRRGGGGVG